MNRRNLGTKSCNFDFGRRLPIGDVCDGENVGRNFVSLLALVDFNNFLGVNGHTLVGVHHHTEQAGISLKQENQCSLNCILTMNLFLKILNSLPISA